MSEPRYKLFYQVFIPRCRMTEYHHKIGMFIRTYDGMTFTKSDIGTTLGVIDHYIDGITWTMRNTTNNGKCIARRIHDHQIDIYNATMNFNKITARISFGLLLEPIPRPAELTDPASPTPPTVEHNSPCCSDGARQLCFINA